MHLALRVFGFQRLMKHTPAVNASLARDITDDELERAHRYGRWIDVAGRHHLVRAQCLHRSLVLHRWLRSDGLPSELRIGVRKENEVLRAHAWVELSGHVVYESPDVIAAFTPLAGPNLEQVAGRGRVTGLWSAQTVSRRIGIQWR
jgi:hypothetical protein